MAINMLVALDAKQKTHGHDGIPPWLEVAYSPNLSANRQGGKPHCPHLFNLSGTL